jgi:hypothetical protein
MDDEQLGDCPYAHSPSRTSLRQTEIDKREEAGIHFPRREYIRPLAVGPLVYPERFPSPRGFFFSTFCSEGPGNETTPSLAHKPGLIVF